MRVAHFMPYVSLPFCIAKSYTSLVKKGAFSPDQGATWVKRWHFARSDIIALVINPARPTELLAGFFSPGLVLISTDAGRAWKTLTD